MTLNDSLITFYQSRIDDLRLSLTYINEPLTINSITVDINYYLTLILQRVKFVNSQHGN
jgi:hypothetical protein